MTGALDRPRSRFREHLPERPYCQTRSDRPPCIRPRVLAARYRHVQPNTPWCVRYLVFDIDRPAGALAWEDAGTASRLRLP